MIPARTLLGVGLAVAILVGVAAVFLASGGPDGLESTTLVIRGEKSLTGPAPSGAHVGENPGGFRFPSPFPDYSVGEGSGNIGSILAILLGIALVFGAAIGIPRILSHRRPGRTKEEPGTPPSPPEDP
ncbi:MAG TPA: PDGLE domain-containing protein [Methanomicrobiales archaeon]|nr:PDGLE domain-containing protein [Methanomicrobiales archaeon]